MRKERALWIVVAMIVVVSSGCVKNFSTSKDIVYQSTPSNAIKAAEEICDSMGYDITQKNANSVRCSWENNFIMQHLFSITKQSDIAIRLKSEKSLDMDVTLIGNAGHASQSNANEIIAEFQTMLDKKLASVNK